MADREPAPPRRRSLLRALKAVAWAFFGVRNSREYQKDLTELKPHHFIIAALIGAALFIVALVLIVNWVLHSGIAA
jgi:hypothetical protein